jgi:hypothetical protein
VAPKITPETVGEYLKLLGRLFVVEAQGAWAPAPRSRAVLRTSPKLHLADFALAAVLLGTEESRLERDLATLGTLFESAAVHGLMVFAARLRRRGSFRLGQVAYTEAMGQEQAVATWVFVMLTAMRKHLGLSVAEFVPLVDRYALIRFLYDNHELLHYYGNEHVVAELSRHAGEQGAILEPIA